MTTITEGMTPDAFILAMNSNFESIKYSTTAVSTIDTNSNITVIDTIFKDILSDTIVQPSISDISIGLNGLEYISRLNNNFQSNFNSNMIFTVGVDKNFTTINAAITRSISGNTLIIDEGSYNESLDLTGKRLNLTGSGTLETTIKYVITSSAVTSPTVDIAQDCVFTNIEFGRTYVENQENYGYILNINNCNPSFNDCKIKCLLTDFRQYVMNIVGSEVNFTGDIDCNSVFFGVAILNRISVNGASVFNFTGSIFKAVLIANDTSVSTINTEQFWVLTEGNSNGIWIYDTATVNLTNTVYKVFAQTTGIEGDSAVNANYLCNIGDSGHFQLTGVLEGFVIPTGLGATALFKDVTGTKGRIEIMPMPPEAAANTNLIVFDNCHLYMDFDDDVSGIHMIEDYRGCEWQIINGSVFEFSGYNGLHHTFGQPLTFHENAKLTIRNSTIIDNCNDKNGYAYLLAILSGELIIEDSTLTNQNWDSLDNHALIYYNKTIDVPIKITLKNVILNSDANLTPILISVTDPQVFDENDYVDAENITNNTGFDICNSMINWAYLIANAP